MIGFEFIAYLSRKGAFERDKARILDVGAQNLLGASETALEEFAEQQGADVVDPEVRGRIFDVARRTVVRPGENTAYLGEFFEICPNVEYVAYDIAPGYKTHIFDFNADELSKEHSGYFDLVLNFGTSEHVMNQVALYKTIHASLKVGGLWFEQLPSFGWVNHGYYTYHPDFYRDMAHTNNYDIIDFFYTKGGNGPLLDSKIKLREIEDLSRDTDALPTPFSNIADIQYLVMNVLMRKTSAEPMRLPLEMRTAHAKVDETARTKYAGAASYHEMGKLLRE